MGILDTVIERTTNSPRIVASNHDTSKIGTGGNPADPSGIKAQIASIRAGNWDQCEYGITAEAQIAKLEAADTPEAREKAMAELRLRAMTRAALDTTNGKVRVMVAGDAARKAWWHKLGTAVDQAVTAADALEFAGLNWKVLKLPALYTLPNGEVRTSAETFVLVREDTGMQLGESGSRYQPIQNNDATQFLDAALDSFGAKYETAGSIYGGKQTWVQAKLPMNLELPGRDVTELTAAFLLDHTGAGADACFATSERIVCANTRRLAAAKDGAKGIRIRHTGDIKGRLADGKKALGLAVHAFDEYRTFAESAYRLPLDVSELGNAVLDSILDVTAAQVKMGAEATATELLATVVGVTQAQRDAETKRVAREMKKRSSILEDIMDRYESSRCQPRGTAWGALQAFDESANYGKWGKELTKDSDSRRLESVLTGDRDDAQQTALEFVRNRMSGSVA